MTDEELARFALVLREADRMQVASDEAAARESGDSILQPPLAEGEQPFLPAVVAA